MSMAFPVSENIGLECRHSDDNYIGNIGGDTGILVFHILLKKASQNINF